MRAPMVATLTALAVLVLPALAGCNDTTKSAPCKGDVLSNRAVTTTHNRVTVKRADGTTCAVDRKFATVRMCSKGTKFPTCETG